MERYSDIPEWKVRLIEEDFHMNSYEPFSLHLNWQWVRLNYNTHLRLLLTKVQNFVWNVRVQLCWKRFFIFIFYAHFCLLWQVNMIAIKREICASWSGSLAVILINLCVSCGTKVSFTSWLSSIPMSRYRACPVWSSQGMDLRRGLPLEDSLGDSLGGFPCEFPGEFPQESL